MRKIYSFSDFSSLYEADAVTPTEASKLYDQTLGLILTTALNAYTSELDFPIASYDANIDADVAAIKSTPVLDKPGALKTIMGKVQKAAADNKSEGAKEAIDAWVAAGSKAVDALTALINQYKDQPEELKYINDSINSKVDEFLENLIDSSKDNKLKADVIAAKESYEFEGAEEISEAMDWLKGKKGMIEDVAKQITLVSAKLSNLAETPGMASSVTKLQAEVVKIAAEMGALLDKKNSEINKDDIKKAAARLAEIPTEADKMAEKMLKQDATNKEASSILVQAFGLVQTAKNLEKEYLNKKEEAKQKETAAKIKVALTVPTVDYTPEETKNVNPEVKKFQELVMDKFGKIKAITSLPQYTKMGTDGKFGPNTRDIVKILKKGFDLQDSSGDITKELVDEIQIQADTIKESNNSRIFKFTDFVNISEAAFNLTAAVDTAKALPTYKPTSTGSGASSKTAAKAEVKKEEVKKEEVKKEDTSLKQALTNNEIQSIAGQLIDASSGTTDEAKFLGAIEKLKNKKDFEVLNSLLSRSNAARSNYKKLGEMGLNYGSFYKNLAAMINGEMGYDDTGTVRLIKDHLKKIGVDANYSSTKDGTYIEDSFTIK
jgi:cellobiose-specific phosphotransferase system component IIB